MDVAALRAQFPVLERVAYLNSGTDGPLPEPARVAAAAELAAEVRDGRAGAHFERRRALQESLRAGYARLIGARAEDVALATSTSDGLGRLLAGLDLPPDSEILTSDQEHPGLLGPLRAARERGIAVRVAPFARLADEVGPRTRLVAASHVSWVGGEVAQLDGIDIPVILDGAQGAGAAPVDVRSLGCAAYAGSGQKWLCGSDGTGFLWLDAAFAERVRTITPSYASFADASRGLDAPLKETAARFDTAALSREAVGLSLAALELLDGFGWPNVQERAAGQAAKLARALARRGHAVAPRGDGPLVAWAHDDPEAARDRLAAAGVIVRNLPGRALLRASVGAWNDDGDLDRLLAAL